MQHPTKNPDLHSLVRLMNEQVRQSEESTTALIHSSDVLKDTHLQFKSTDVAIRDGGKLLARVTRKERIDNIFLVLALLFYFGVVLYILRRRLGFPWFI